MLDDLKKMIEDQKVAGNLKARFERRGVPWTANNLKQALFPQGATIIPNPVGTAPGFNVDIGQGKKLLWLSGVPLAPALHAFLHAATANLISAGVRLIPLGQTDGQRVLAALEPVIAEVAARALRTPLEEVGGAAFRADIASLRHETQYTRLFRS